MPAWYIHIGPWIHERGSKSAEAEISTAADMRLIIGACETRTDSLWSVFHDLCIRIRSHTWRDVSCLAIKASGNTIIGRNRRERGSGRTTFECLSIVF